MVPPTAAHPSPHATLGHPTAASAPAQVWTVNGAAGVNRPGAEFDGVAIKAKVNGFDGKTVSNANGVNQLLTRVSKYQNTSQTAGGFDAITPFATADGFRLKLDMRTQQSTDPISVMLWAEVFDPKNKIFSPILLDFLQHSTALGGNKATKVFDVSYADLNAYLKKATGNPNLEVTPGVTPLTVAAQWTATGHRAGGPGEGTFIPPVPLGQAAGAAGAQRVAAKGALGRAEDIPLDIAFKVPTSMHNDYALTNVLDIHGEISSRLEGEAKIALGTGRTKVGDKVVVGDKQLWAKVASELYRVAALSAAGDNSAFEALAGPGWSIIAGHKNPKTDRFYLKDTPANANQGVAGTGDFAGFRVDAETKLPLLDGYIDTAYDDSKLTMTHGGHTFRVRADARKSELQIKYGGTRPPAGFYLRNRGEFAIPIKPGTHVFQLSKFLQTINTPPPVGRYYHTVLNSVGREMAEVGVDLAAVAANSSELFKSPQNRHKFAFKHVSGLEVEGSVDQVLGTTVRPEHMLNGKPREIEMYVMEAEVDHKQVNSANVKEVPSNLATGTGAPLDEAAQVAIFAKLSNEATLNVEPSLHTKAQLTHPGLRDTPEQKAGEALIKKLVTTIIGKQNTRVSDPKPQEMARALNLIPDVP